MGRQKRSYLMRKQFETRPPSFSFPYACKHCHHIFLDQKAKADHLWSECKQFSNKMCAVMCKKHPEVQTVIERKTEEEDTAKYVYHMDQDIHETVCGKRNDSKVLSKVSWNWVWKYYQNVHLHMKILPADENVRVFDEGYTFSTRDRREFANTSQTLKLSCEEIDCPASILIVGQHSFHRIDPCFYLRSNKKHMHAPNLTGAEVKNDIQVDSSGTVLREGSHNYHLEYEFGETKGYKCVGMCAKSIIRVGNVYRKFPDTEHFHRPSYTDIVEPIIEAELDGLGPFVHSKPSDSDPSSEDELEECEAAQFGNKLGRIENMRFLLKELELICQAHFIDKSAKLYIQETCLNLKSIFKPTGSVLNPTCILPDFHRSIKFESGLLLHRRKQLRMTRKEDIIWQQFCSHKMCYSYVYCGLGNEYPVCQLHLPLDSALSIYKLTKNQCNKLGIPDATTAYFINSSRVCKVGWKKGDLPYKCKTGSVENQALRRVVKTVYDMEHCFTFRCKDSQESKVWFNVYVIFLKLISMVNTDVCCVNTTANISSEVMYFLKFMLRLHSCSITVNPCKSSESSNAYLDRVKSRGFLFDKKRIYPNPISKSVGHCLYILCARSYYYVGRSTSNSIPKFHFTSDIHDGASRDDSVWGSILRSHRLTDFESHVFASTPKEHSFLMETLAIIASSINSDEGFSLRIAHGKEMVNQKLVFEPTFKSHNVNKLLQDISVLMFGTTISIETKKRDSKLVLQNMDPMDCYFIS